MVFPDDIEADGIQRETCSEERWGDKEPASDVNGLPRSEEGKRAIDVSSLVAEKACDDSTCVRTEPALCVGSPSLSHLTFPGSDSPLTKTQNGQNILELPNETSNLSFRDIPTPATHEFFSLTDLESDGSIQIGRDYDMQYVVMPVGKPMSRKEVLIQSEREDTAGDSRSESTPFSVGGRDEVIVDESIVDDHMSIETTLRTKEDEDTPRSRILFPTVLKHHNANASDSRSSVTKTTEVIVSGCSREEEKHGPNTRSNDSREAAIIAVPEERQAERVQTAAVVEGQEISPRSFASIESSRGNAPFVAGETTDTAVSIFSTIPVVEGLKPILHLSNSTSEGDNSTPPVKGSKSGSSFPDVTSFETATNREAHTEMMDDSPSFTSSGPPNNNNCKQIQVMESPEVSSLFYLTQDEMHRGMNNNTDMSNFEDNGRCFSTRMEVQTKELFWKRDCHLLIHYQ
jgi:hypothetical protein